MKIKLTTELLKRFHAHGGAWQSLHEALATIDVLLAFGEFAAGAECATCRPVFMPQGTNTANLVQLSCDSTRLCGINSVAL